VNYSAPNEPGCGGPEQETAFAKAKEALTKPIILPLYHPGSETKVTAKPIILALHHPGSEPKLLPMHLPLHWEQFFSSVKPASGDQ